LGWYTTGTLAEKPIITSTFTSIEKTNHPTKSCEHVAEEPRKIMAALLHSYLIPKAIFKSHTTNSHHQPSATISQQQL
jgi:hypothetical protein